MKRHLVLLAIVFICSCKKNNKPPTFTDGFFKHMPSAGSIGEIIYDSSSQSIYLGGSAGASDGVAGLLNLGDWQVNSKGRNDAILMKYNLDGKLAWAKLIGGNSGDAISGVAVDNDQNVYVTGIFGGTVNFDGTELKAQTSYVNDQTVFIAKYNKDGKQLWVKKVTNAGIIGVAGIAVDISNNKLYIAGSFDKRLTIGDAVYNKDGGGIFIASYSLNGALSWSKTYGDKEGRPFITGLKLFNDGSLLLSGTSTGRQAIDGYEISGGSQAAFFARFDAAGNTIWAKTVGNTVSNPAGLAIDESNNFYLSAGFDGTVTIGNKLLKASGPYGNAVLVKYNQAGDVVWVTPLLSPTYSEIADVYYFNKKVYTAGYYSVAADFGGITIPAADNKAQGYSARYDSEDGKCESAANFESGNSFGSAILAINGYSYILGRFESSYTFQGFKFNTPNGSSGLFMKFKTP
jgi:hypothetical protein